MSRRLMTWLLYVVLLVVGLVVLVVVLVMVFLLSLLCHDERAIGFVCGPAPPSPQVTPKCDPMMSSPLLQTKKNRAYPLLIVEDQYI